MPRLKAMFRPAFDPYQSIIVQNIIKAKSFSFCYEVARQLHGRDVPPNGYIAKLKQLLTEQEWNVVKKLHKSKKPFEIPDKCRSLPLSPLQTAEKARHPEAIKETSLQQE